ncbi:BCCT family transporter [Luteimonas panaciterrae]|uniref:BCCT family transporter n=1 Tax=Luteimonas panaciterrae TaxID=363885 RepID=UPI001CFB0BF5|nr:BCCT family transporter [Luteimonas panaciterrae]
MSSTQSNANSKQAMLNPVVFFCSAGSALALALLMVLYPKASKAWLDHAQAAVSKAFGWYYMLVIVACLVFVLWLAFSRFGNVRLGRDDETPEFSYRAWVSMLFSAGIGIALLYYGAYEPLDHFLSPPVGQGGTTHAAREALTITFLHWGLHGWALYALIGTALAYFAYRKGLPLALRSALYPIFGDRIHGWIGHVVDACGILATLISMVTNLGIGALMLNSGLSYLFDIPQTAQVLLILVGMIMLVATIAVVSGVEKGIAWLSNLNVWLLCLLLLFVVLCGPTMHLFDGLVQNTGDYLRAFVGKSFEMYLYDEAAKNWAGAWTLFYWAWWIAWAPFAGMFIARISRGRTIKELILGVLLIPLGFTLAWLSIFGNTAIDVVFRQGAAELGAVAQADPPMALFKLLEYLPFTRFIALAAVMIGFVLFLTPVDSGTLMIANLCTSNGSEHEDAPIWLRLFWAMTITVVSMGLFLTGGSASFSSMQTAVVLCGLPFSVVLVLYIVSLCKALNSDTTQ